MSQVFSLEVGIFGQFSEEFRKDLFNFFNISNPTQTEEKWLTSNSIQDFPCDLEALLSIFVARTGTTSTMILMVQCPSFLKANIEGQDHFLQVALSVLLYLSLFFKASKANASYSKDEKFWRHFYLELFLDEKK